MLRAWVVLLVLANLAFFAWTQGWVDEVAGARARGDREPERLGRQVQPEVVQILSAQGAKGAAASVGSAVASAAASSVAPSAASTPPPPAATTAPDAATPASVPAPPAPLACLEAGPYNSAEATAAEGAVRAALPEGSWVSVKSGRPGLWMVYMGRFKDRDDLLKKQDELRGLRVEYDELRGPADLLPGLSLGRFEERGNAVNALEKFSLRGIRTAKVVEVRAPASTVMLRVDKAAPALATQVAALSSTALGKGFAPCVKAVSN